MHGHPLIWYTFKNILDSKLLDEIVIVVKDTEKSQFQQILSEFKHAIPIKWGQGGNTRVDSVINGISQISSKSEKLLIHDGARPLVGGDAIDQILNKLGPAHPAVIFCASLYRYNEGDKR